MQNDRTDQQPIDPYDLSVPHDLRFCKRRGEGTNRCAPDYDINALSNCFFDLSRFLSENGVGELLHSLLKGKNRWDSLLKPNTTIEAVQGFSYANTSPKLISDGFEK